MASVVENVQSGLSFATLPGLIRDASLLNVCSRFRPYIGQFSCARTLALASNATATTSPASNRAGRIVSSLITGLVLLSCYHVDAAETVIPKPDGNTRGTSGIAAVDSVKGSRARGAGLRQQLRSDADPKGLTGPVWSF